MTKPKHIQPSEDRDLIFELLAGGMSCVEVARKFELSRSRVHQYYDLIKPDRKQTEKIVRENIDRIKQFESQGGGIYRGVNIKINREE